MEHTLALALCLGLGSALWLRSAHPAVAGAAVVCLLGAAAARRGTLPLLAVALAIVGLWWGSARLEQLDRSDLVRYVDSSVSADVEVTGPVRVGMFDLRAPVRVLQVDGVPISEAAQLELPVGEPVPRRGVRLRVRARVRLPDGPRVGRDGRTFDEASILARRAVHVVLDADGFEVTGRRGGPAGVSDRLREHIRAALGRGVGAERASLARGIVLGEDEGIDADLLDAFRASGLFHLLRK